MAGGNRAFTLQDVLGTLNQNQGGDSSNDSNTQLNQILLAPEGATVAESVAHSLGSTSANWNSGNWGQFPWS